MEPRLTTMKERAREHKKEKRKQALTERQAWNRWCAQKLHTLPKSRMVWAKATFDKMVARGVIADWAWARGERRFIFPMTKPALSEDQLVCVLNDFFRWDEQQPDEGCSEKRSDFMD